MIGPADRPGTDANFFPKDWAHLIADRLGPRTFVRVIRCLVALLAVAVPLAACSSPRGSGEGNALVMQRPAGTSSMSGVPAGMITDVYVPVVFNRSASPLRVLSVQLTDPPPGIKILETSAFHTVGLPVGIMAPDVVPTASRSPALTRSWGARHPVSAITLPAHGRANWVAVIVLTTAAGTYHFTGVRITYTTGGQGFWQAEGLSAYIRYSATHIAAYHQS
jgi:hypothetical protein